MILLAIDTAAGLCAASVHDTDAGERGRCVRDLGKGHAEHLMGSIADALAGAGCSYGDLDAIAVSIGPGSFTGIRVGVATARGLALACKVPAIGITTLEALALDARSARPGRAVLAALDGGRGQIHAALYDADGAERAAPAVHDAASAAGLAVACDAVLVGTAAPAIAELVGGPDRIVSCAATADIASYARLAAARTDDAPRPVPLYLRDADARVQEGFALPRLARP